MPHKRTPGHTHEGHKHVGLREYLSKFRLTRTEDREIVNDAPLPVMVIGSVTAADTVLPLTNNAGEITEANSATIEIAVDAVQARVLDNGFYIRNATPLGFHADGVAIDDALEPWIPFVPVTVTADGAGLPPATQIIPLVAALNLDVMIWMQVDTVAGANMYQFDFRTDPLAAVGGIVVTDPDWTAIELPLPANGVTPSNTYGHRMMTTAVANAFGIAQGANGDWPNGAQVTFYGFYRAV